MTATAARAEIDLEWIVAQHGRRELRPRLAATRLRHGRGRARIENLTVPTRRTARARRRPAVARRAGGRDRLHLRADGRRPHRADGGRRRPAADPPADGPAARQATSPACSIAERIAAGPRARARGPPARRPGPDDDRRRRTCRSPLIGAFTRGLFTSSKREQDAHRPRQIRDVTVKTAGGGAPIGSLSRRQPAEGRHRQDAARPTLVAPARRAHPRHRHRRQGARSSRSARRGAERGPGRGLLAPPRSASA